jgi:hypothetical protein
MSVRCVPSSGRASQIGQVPRTSWGSVFALARVCTAPMQPRYFTHYYSRMFVRTRSLTLDAMGVCVRARVCQGCTRSRRPLGGRFSTLHACAARQCSRVRSPTDYYACPCAHVQRHSMQYVYACVQMAYMMLCAHGNLMQVLYNVYTGGRFSPFRASPARQCSRAPSPAYHCEFSCAQVECYSMQCVCACVHVDVRGLHALQDLFGVRFRVHTCVLSVNRVWHLCAHSLGRTQDA